MSLSSCFSSVEIKRELIRPPEALTSPCPYRAEPDLYTQQALGLWIIHLTEQLDKCNLKQEQELTWFIDLQEKLDNADDETK